MSVQFKEPTLEAQLQGKVTHLTKTHSHVALRDLERYEFLLATEPPMELTKQEYLAFASTVLSMPHLRQPSQIRRLALLVEDAMLSSTSNLTGEFSKETIWKGFKVKPFVAKLYAATPLQLLVLLERVEPITKEILHSELVAQRG